MIYIYYITNLFRFRI